MFEHLFQMDQNLLGIEWEGDLIADIFTSRNYFYSSMFYYVLYICKTT